MDQLEEIVGIVKTISEYLRSGKMGCDQVPTDDILYVIREEYKRAGQDPTEASNYYGNLINGCVLKNDSITLSNVLNCVVLQCMTLTELYGIRVTNFDLKLYPYKAEIHYYRNLIKNQEWLKNNSAEKISDFSGRGAVFSAITGGYDSIRDPEVVDDRLDYYLFTDSDNIQSDVYKVIKVDNEEVLDPVRLSKKIKIIGNWEYLPEYDFTIWMDGKLQITGDLMGYIKEYSKGAPLLCFNHYNRDDLYEEARVCSSIGIDYPEIIQKQVERYRAEGFPERYGLIDACLLVKDNKSESLKRAMNDWWTEVKNGSKRDQLSFSYAFWKNNVIFDTSPLLSIDNPIVRTHKHTL